MITAASRGIGASLARQMHSRDAPTTDILDAVWEHIVPALA